MLFLNHLDLIFRKLETTVAILAMSGVVGILSAQVFYRYVLNSPIFFAEEVALVLMIMATFAGLSILVAESKLIGIDLVGPHLSDQGQFLLEVLVRFAVALISMVLAFYAIRYVATPWVWFERFATIPLPRTTLYTFVTIELCLMAFHQIINILNSVYVSPNKAQT